MSTLRARSDGSEATDVSLYHTLFYSRCAFLCMLLSYPSVIIGILTSDIGSESQTYSGFGENLSVFARQAHNSNGMLSCSIPCTDSCPYRALHQACRHSSVDVRTGRRWRLPAVIGDGVAEDAMHLSSRRRQCVMRRSSFAFCCSRIPDCYRYRVPDCVREIPTGGNGDCIPVLTVTVVRRAIIVHT